MQCIKHVCKTADNKMCPINAERGGGPSPSGCRQQCLLGTRPASLGIRASLSLLINSAKWICQPSKEMIQSIHSIVASADRFELKVFSLESGACSEKVPESQRTEQNRTRPAGCFSAPSFGRIRRLSTCHQTCTVTTFLEGRYENNTAHLVELSGLVSVFPSRRPTSCSDQQVVLCSS